MRNCVPKCGNPGCICIDGFIRNSIGECVPISSCRKYMLKISLYISFNDKIIVAIVKFSATNICNRPNEIYSGCGDDGCQRSCDRLNIVNCGPRCGPPACICAYGFVKNSIGDCVAVSSCRKFFLNIHTTFFFFLRKLNHFIMFKHLFRARGQMKYSQVVEMMGVSGDVTGWIYLIAHRHVDLLVVFVQMDLLGIHFGIV